LADVSFETNVCFAPMVLKGWRGERGMRKLASLGRLWRGQWNQLCRLPEVLDRGSEEALVLSAKWTSRPEAIEAQDALEMCEQHLDFSSVHAAMSRRPRSWQCRVRPPALS
jgi:hypothetical protein